MALVHRVGWDPEFPARSAWFWPLARAARQLRDNADWPTRGELEAIAAEGARDTELAPLCFGPNVDRAAKYADGRVVLDALYDARIARRGEVPTRERDWHDLFNALCFATFPRAKRALHARQYRALAERIADDARALPSTRSREQDALTLFDEGGMALAADARAASVLASCDVHTLPEALARFEREGHARLVPFGHALFEHLVEGIACPGGGTRLLELATVPDDAAELVRAVDRELSARLADPRQFLSPAEHLPLRFNRMAEVAPVKREVAPAPLLTARAARRDR
jgi:hypothetical protein